VVEVFINKNDAGGERMISSYVIIIVVVVVVVVVSLAIIISGRTEWESCYEKNWDVNERRTRTTYIRVYDNNGKYFDKLDGIDGGRVP